MERIAAWVVVALGTVLIVGGIVGAVDAAREGDGSALVPRLLILALVAFGVARAVVRLREPTASR